MRTGPCFPEEAEGPAVLTLHIVLNASTVKENRHDRRECGPIGWDRAAPAERLLVQAVAVRRNPKLLGWITSMFDPMSPQARSDPARPFRGTDTKPKIRSQGPVPCARRRFEIVDGAGEGPYRRRLKAVRAGLRGFAKDNTSPIWK